MPIIDVTCAIIFKEEKILLTQRSEKMKLPLLWEFPGGKVENGETAEVCLLREIKEELNLEISLLDRLESHVHNYGEFSINLIPFTASYIGGEILLSEHKNYEWLDIAEIGKRDLAPADIPILGSILKMYNDATRAL